MVLLIPSYNRLNFLGQVTFGSIQKDATGLHFDQGPFIMVYSREGPRPSEAEMPFIDTLGAHEVDRVQSEPRRELT